MERKRLPWTISYVPFFLGLSLCISLTGCAGDSTAAYDITALGGQGAEGALEGAPETMESGGVLEYSAVEQNPHLIVDRSGYSAKEEKYALIVAEKMPDYFYVKNATTNAVVYTGTPYGVTYDESTGEYEAELRFESLETEGTYYIYSEEFGSSYSFEISNNYYRDIFTKLVLEEYDKCKKGEASADEVIALLYVYEKYPSTLPAYEGTTPEILSAVMEWIGKADFDSATGEEAYKYATILAKFSVDYKKIDSVLATECLQKAAAIYEEKADSSKYPDAHFMTSVELYRACGEADYVAEANALEEYIDSLDHPQDSRELLYGSIIYMTIRLSVDRDFCNCLMSKLLGLGESVIANKNLLDVNNSKPNVSLLLGYALQVQALNYVLDAYEYNGLIADIMHYLNGRNYGGYMGDVINDYPADSLVIYAWLSDLETDGKLDSSALTDWNYEW